MNNLAGKTILIIIFVMIGFGCGKKQAAGPSPEEIQTTKLINKFIAICKRNDAEQGGGSSAKYYRNAGTAEIVCEVTFPKKVPQLSEEQLKATRATFIDQIGTALSVGDIREYEKHEIVFIFKGITPEGKEVCLITIPFKGLLNNWSHPGL